MRGTLRSHSPGAHLLNLFLGYYAADGLVVSFLDHRDGELLLYMNQIEWAAPGESEAETELRLAYMHARFEIRVRQPAESGDFHPHRHFPNDFDRTLADLAEEAS